MGRLPALMTRISHLWTSSLVVYLEGLGCSPVNAGHAEVIALCSANLDRVAYSAPSFSKATS